MTLDKQIRSESYHYGLQLFSLPDKRRLTEYEIKHQRLGGDLYVAYTLAGARFWQMPDETTSEYDEIGLIPDRQFIYDTKIVFFEVDRGGEDYNTPKGIKGKVEKYIRLSQLHPDHRFHVCFTTVDEIYPTGKIKRTAEARAKGILRVFEDYHRADMLMVTLHKFAVAMPEEAIWTTDNHPLGVSLTTAT